MSIKIITNEVWHDSVTLHVGVSGSGLFDPTDAYNVTTGPRHLKTKTDLADRRVTYVNKSGGLSADTIIVAGLHNASGHQVSVGYHTTYTDDWTGITLLFSDAAFSETLVGAMSQDYVLEFTQVTNKQAFHLLLEGGTGGAYVEEAIAFYAGNAYEFTHPEFPVIERPLYRTEKFGNAYYKLEGQATLQFTNVSNANLETFENIENLQTQPLFVYDSNGTFLRDKLWHCFISEYNVQPLYDDLNDVSVTLKRLRSYG